MKLVVFILQNGRQILFLGRKTYYPNVKLPTWVKNLLRTNSIIALYHQIPRAEGHTNPQSNDFRFYSKERRQR
jgi:hypothetical protein